MFGLTTIVLVLGANVFGLSGQSIPQPPRATLGAEANAFTSKFGKPLKELYAVAKYYVPCAGSENGAKWGVTFKGTQASGIERWACAGEGLDAAMAAKEATAMMPQDAKLVRDFRTTDGRQAHEYASESLGKLLPRDAFVTCDAEGRVKPAGVGSLSYAIAADGRSWMLILGTCF